MNDALELCDSQHDYAYQLKELGVIDDVIEEAVDAQNGTLLETYQAFPYCARNITAYIARSFNELAQLTPEVGRIESVPMGRPIGFYDSPRRVTPKRRVASFAHVGLLLCVSLCL